MLAYGPVCIGADPRVLKLVCLSASLVPVRSFARARCSVSACMVSRRHVLVDGLRMDGQADRWMDRKTLADGWAGQAHTDRDGEKGRWRRAETIRRR